MPDAPADPAGRAPRQGPLRARLARADAFLFGPRPSRPPGPAVRAAIARNARSSEILVCLVQAAAVALFGAVYAVTPKAFPPSAPFEPVPAVLFAYALFTAARFALARRDRLGAPALALSAVLDVAVLMVTIWSFHLQYQAPPAVYLKAPTLLYVFIMIALRALRLEAWPVLLTGAAAMAGWAGLVAYAATAGEARVTGDWLGYMTSGAILIGAEVDKMLAIGAVTGVLAVAVTRARRLMILAAAEREAAGALSRFFPAEIADAIREARRPNGSARPRRWRCSPTITAGWRR
jgi:adenylate cyclase